LGGDEVKYFPVNIRLARIFATHSKCSLVRVAFLSFVLLGYPPVAVAKTYVEIARALVADLPPDARIREDLEAELLAQANGYRATRGVAALKPSSRMLVAARAQAIDMMLNNFVGHRSSSGYEFDSRARYFLGNPAQMPQMAENAARETQKGEADASKADRLFQQWVHSAPHRKSLINSGYKFVSTGVVQRGNKIWAIQIFFAPPPTDIEAVGSDGLY
jgi:uncharacterized protein YkwD